MKEKIWAVILAVLVFITGYLMVSSAAKHTALDSQKLHAFHMEYNCVHP